MREKSIKPVFSLLRDNVIVKAKTIDIELKVEVVQELFCLKEGKTEWHLSFELQTFIHLEQTW